MREFMAKVRDRLSEGWNDPERREDRLAVVIIGATAAVVVIALLLVLWGYLMRGGRQEAENDMSGNTLQATAYEEKMQEYMAQNEGQAALWRECAAKVENLNGEVDRLLEVMAKTEETLAATAEQYQEGDTRIQKELTAVHIQVDAVVQELREVQTRLYDLTDIVQIMDEETIPFMRQQIAQLESDMERTQGDIVSLYEKLDALKKEDGRLWKSIGDLENMLEDLKSGMTGILETENGKLWESIEELKNALGNVADDLTGTLEKEDGKLWESIEELKDTLENVEHTVAEMDIQTLRYRYDEQSRTLYLDPSRD